MQQAQECHGSSICPRVKGLCCPNPSGRAILLNHIPGLHLSGFLVSNEDPNSTKGEGTEFH